MKFLSKNLKPIFSLISLAPLMQLKCHGISAKKVFLQLSFKMVAPYLLKYFLNVYFFLASPNLNLIVLPPPPSLLCRINVFLFKEGFTIRL